MPFALVTIGLLMIITGAKGSYACFGRDIADDFTGEKNFTYWLVAVGAVGSLGYIEKLRPLSQAFMALTIIAMIIKNQGFFQMFMQAIESGPVKTDCATGSGSENSSSYTGEQFNEQLSSLTEQNAASLEGIQAEGTKRIGNAGNVFGNIVTSAIKFYGAA